MPLDAAAHSRCLPFPGVVAQRRASTAASNGSAAAARPALSPVDHSRCFPFPGVVARRRASAASNGSRAAAWAREDAPPFHMQARADAAGNLYHVCFEGEARPAHTAPQARTVLAMELRSEFDAEAPAQLDALGRLWSAHHSFDDDVVITGYPEKSETWVAIGFQGTSPGSDVRGGGALALRALAIVAELDADAGNARAAYQVGFARLSWPRPLTPRPADTPSPRPPSPPSGPTPRKRSA